MASPFAEAITQSMIAGLDPMNGVIRQYAEQTTATQQDELYRRKSETIAIVEAKLADALERQAHGSVVAAYTKLLASVTA